MSNTELLAKIKAEIERISSRAMNEEGQDLCEYLLSFISSIEEKSEKLSAERDKDMIVSIEMWLHEIEPKWVEKELAWLDELRTRLLEEEPEKPMNQDGLDEEIERYLHSLGVGYGGWVDGMDDEDLRGIARHFAKWGADHAPLPEDTVLFNKGVAEGKRLMMEDAVKWLVDDDYHEASEKGRFILGSVGLGYNGYYIPYLDLLKLPKEDDK